MNRSSTRLNTALNPQNPIPAITKTVLSLFCILFLMLNDKPVVAQAINCPNGEPLQWTWIQNLIEQSAGCVVGSIQQFEYNGDTYISVSPGSMENGYQCPSDHVFSRYTCQGDFICSFGAVNGTGCDPDFENAARTGTTIWIYDDNLQGSCDSHLGTFFYADCGGINYYFIELEDGRIFDPYFAVDPGYYPEEGQQIRFDFELKTDVSTPCDISESPITITCFEPYEANTNCPAGNPIEWDWVQSIINQGNVCAVGSISIQEYDDGNRYIVTYPGDEPALTALGFPPLPPCDDHDPIITYNCQGQLICMFDPINFPTCDMDNLGQLVNSTLIWEYEPTGDETACTLPLDEGICDNRSVRYYYDSDIGSCQQFVYNGCGGNANNYLTYAKCVDACNLVVTCPEGDPLEWDWIQAIINEETPCLHGSIEVWEYDDGNIYIKTFPGEQSFSTTTLDGPWCNVSAVPTKTYTCQGQLLCEFEPIHFPYCYMGDLGTVVNSTTIWTYEFDCSDPFQTAIVQDAIEDDCTNSIYNFEYEGKPYIYIKKGCDYKDVLYDCETNRRCSITGGSFGVFGCASLIESVQALLSDENTIWTNNCNYETTGTVYNSETCGLYIGCCLDSQFEIVTLPDSFELVEGNIVEFSYEPTLGDICLPLGMPVDITCIRTVAEDCGCPPVAKPATVVCGLDGNTYNSACLANCYANGVAYEGECRDCNMDNPLEESWIKELIITGEGCTVYEISQFEYNGSTHFAMTPKQDCVSDPWVSYYDCFGNLVCTEQVFFEPCDPALSVAANSATTIWTYNQADCTNPLETEFVQNWLNNECQPEAIYSFEFEGETYIYVEPGGYCFDYFLDESSLFYNCNAGITCNLTSALLSYYDFYCFNISELFLTSALNSNNLIWTKPCAYETTGEVINIGDYLPAEYIYDEDCDLVINLSSIGFVVSPTALPDGFTLTEGQMVEFTYLHTYNNYPSSACSDVGLIDIICIREAGGNQNNMDRVECPQNHTTSICAPVTMPPSLTMQDFSTSTDPSYMNSMSMQMQEQTNIQQYFNTTTRTYTITDEYGNQKTCETKHHIANQFLQMPEVSQPGVICEEDLWSYVKIGTDQYMLYTDQNGSKGSLMSICNTPSLVCSTADLEVDTNQPNQYHFWASTYFEFPDGTICESEAMPFYVDVQAKPTAALSTQNKTINLGEGIELMDLVNENKSGYWKGENILYLITPSGDNIPYFSANKAGVFKLYYTVRNEFCERSYLMIIEVDGSSGKAETVLGIDQPGLLTFNLYPNPARDKVFIELSNQANYQLILMDISGKVIKQMSIEQSMIELDVNDLPKGMYMVKVKNESDIYMQKLVIE